MANDNVVASSLPQPQRVTFTLPPFWPEQPAAWFAQIEGQFLLNGVTDDEKKYYLVTGSLDSRYVSEVLDIIVAPPPENKYIKIKKELIDRLSTSQEKKTRQLLEFEELGDRKPSQFLRHLRGLAGKTMPDDLLRTIWISRLPAYAQAILATVAAQPLDDAARLADQVCETWPKGSVAACNAVPTPPIPEVRTDASKDMFDVSAISLQLSAISARLEQLEQNGRPTERQPNRNHHYNYRRRSRSRSRPRVNNPDYCFYHDRFGQRARKCREPCSFQKN
ncbi:hypothetical protein RN001_014913 [Aquatica leii]|uniref:DUF7041 domain-containing protein n=1 Tax=Aquatica leii TaxID=1421715 RepID=A0AAN7PNZ9_9COLE|nr:hypothetical protein RN001_014913 [Aquatica leii]